MKASRLFGAVIAAAMSFCFIAGIQNTGTDARVYAEENGFIIATDTDGDKYISGYNGSGGSIVIPSDVVWIGENAFSKNTSITSVTIPKTCWYWVDKNAFKDCTSLKTVTFEGSIDGIGENAFNGCTALERVTFGGDVGREDGSGGIGYRAFYGCSSLKILSFSDTSAKLDMIGEYAFMNCTSLSQAELPADLSVIYSGAFLNCGSLTVVSVPAVTKLDGEHIFGYMYGSKEKDGKRGFVVADGQKKLYIDDSSKSTAQEPITLVAASGSDAERYASENGISYMYGVTAVSSKKLPAPANVKAKKGTNKVLLEWDAVNGAAGYRVYMYNPVSGKYELYKSVKSTKCTVTGLTAGNEYKFKVTALKGSNGRYTAGTASEAVSCKLKAAEN
ncbi:MAG: fibronectin type III domain-containing protein [Oscillospiraceae bacterium]|nr:fibronectin type III domain-containing protein [Oscillospiraceae bacterium]